MAHTLLRGDALRVFNRAALEAGMETNEHLQQVMNAVTKHVFPRCTLAKQKRWMCRQLHKPKDMTVRQYVTAIQEMNQDFKYFPDAGDNPFLPEDEMADVVEAGCPTVWQREELIQGFDAMEHSLTELMEFFECPESAEQLCGGNPNQTEKSNKDRADANSHKRGRNQGAQVPAKSQRGCQNHSSKCKRQGKWYTLHESDSHDVTECEVFNVQIESMKASHKTKYNRNLHGGQHGSKNASIQKDKTSS